MDSLSVRSKALLLYVALTLGAALIYSANVGHNPPGFYIDESSIGYNAHLIATTGRDEHGVQYPLFFRAFGDYKNPVYVYLIATVYKFTGPSMLAARIVSALLGALNVLVLTLLAFRLSQRWEVAAITASTALLMPWFFEVSRVVIEVAMYPVVLGLFLLCLYRLQKFDSSRALNAVLVAVALALVTYTYSIGRLLGPLLAIGLLIFARVVPLRSLLLIYGLYVLLLLPMLIFKVEHPGALTGRFALVTFITEKSSYSEIAYEFARHYIANLNPWRMVVTGDPNKHQIAAITGTGFLLLPTLLLATTGIVVVLKRHRGNRWWWFVLYGLAVSLVPASLTKEEAHMLRLIAVPVFLTVLSIPALQMIVEKRTRSRTPLLVVITLAILAHGLFVQWKYHSASNSAWRRHLFDADYKAKILDNARIAAPTNEKIYLADHPAIPGYIQAFWYGLLNSIPHDKFIVLPPTEAAPDNAIVITTEDTCPRCKKIAESEPYTLYKAVGPAQVPVALPNDGCMAQIDLVTLETPVKASEPAKLTIAVKNIGSSVWIARERGASPLQIAAGNHWLTTGGDMVINDDGRGTLPWNLYPGQDVQLGFPVNAPKKPGDYLLEIDMLQEGVSWFGPRGSRTLRIPVTVK